MPDKTQKAMIQEIWQALYGVPETDDMGMYGEFKEACKKLSNNTKRITKLEIALASLIAILIGAGVLDRTGIIQIFGG